MVLLFVGLLHQVIAGGCCLVLSVVEYVAS
jgi:hypothetical protein